MEGAESGSRSSGILSIMNREHIERINTDTRYIQSNSMAAPISASPASARYSNGAPYSAGWPASSHSGLISPPESRRTSDEKAPPHQLQTNTHRQSLPSIQEALSSTSAKPVPYASPVSASAPPSHPQIPYSQTQVLPPPRTYEQGTFQSSQSRQPSPPVPIQPPPFPRTDLDSRSFAEPRRQSLLHPTISQPPPANSYPAPRYEAPRYEQEPRVAERFVERSMNEYGQPAPLHNQHPYGNAPTQSVQPPHPPPQAQGYPQPPYPPRDDRDLGGPGYKNYKSQNEPFNQGLKRQLEVWDVDNNLAQINVSSTSLQEWSRHFHAISQEQPRSHIAIPERSPDRRAIEEMLIHGNRVVSCLHRMLDTAVQQQHAADEQSRGARLAPDYDDESIYGDDRHHQNFGGPDNKKRRGRAAPPGRCHSCNRAETPEWRRGPDGARTLCNACGLHYAKLTRKNTMKQSQGSTGSSLRPKSSEDHSPRS
ncbi:hypothetical protein sscle_16g109570 [Sclerotinia sclerotiorum 1980 UF-70]|uniref:GATA-type domain-containing protein n=2 Tax=Sclerotinia sclerotiorum TaxID=5180 RepID=A0A1D9QMN1_SCLS1|nr:light-responsive transcription factor 1 [Sclerotinia sclerotiorum]APA16187.1 hypothetical protein sscle_16g109570 [Sclerotinia sclerotiorum 1980 UF-70]